MTVTAIAAIAENFAIGKNNDLLWDLPIDMRFFMDTTKGHHIITGRRNYESIPQQYRPLKGRTNIVVTRSANYQAPGAVVVHTLADALAFAETAGETETFIIGGGEIYTLAMQANLLDKMYITHVHGSYEGDTFYPKFDLTQWKAKVLADHQADEKHEVGFTITEYTRP
jgi:dihydrofolate reductase